jgi:CheY-like chemotaxis protein
VVLTVSDTGVGMSPETASRAFEPFFTTKEAGRGTGLGLSQVYGFVMQSGGHVRLESQLGLGTTVTIYLPRSDRPVAGDPPREPRRAGEVCGEAILVVEDDQGVRKYSVDALGDLGYRVLEAADAPAAMQLLRHHPEIALLFTDVILPGPMTGADIAAEARKLRAGMPVLFTTGYARDVIVPKGRLEKDVQLLPKPFSFDELATKIRQALDGDSGAAGQAGDD